MKYIVMSNYDPLLIVNSEKDAHEYVEEIEMKFLKNKDSKRPRIWFAKCKSESDFGMTQHSLARILWIVFWLILYVANMVPFLMEDSMKNGICMLMCLIMVLNANRSNQNGK